ncbi:MAG: CHASE2 domain-containing protein [Chthoniobacterales bacterium]
MPWLNRYRLLVIAAICAFCTTVVLLGHFLPSIPFLSNVWSGEQRFQDVMQREGRKTAPHPELVFVGIDQASLVMPPLLPEELADNRAFQLMTERSFPWSREVWAIFLDRLFQAGARTVIFDIVFSPTNDGDPAFRAALDRYRERVVLGADFEFGKNRQAVLPNEDLIPPPQLKDPRVGYVIYFPDPIDGKVRGARYTLSDRQLADLPPHPSQEIFESLSARALEQMGHPEAVPRDLQFHRLRFGEANAYPPKSLYEVFDPKLWKANFANGAFFKGKVVIVGVSAQIQHDVVTTPMSSSLAGPVLHLHAIAAALDHEFLQETSRSTNFALVVLAGLLAFLLTGFLRRPLICIILLSAIAGGYLLASRLFYDRSGLFILVIPVLATFLVSGLFSLSFDYVLERMEKLRTRRTLERYVSKNLVKDIMENPASFYSTMKGARVPVTVLFSDLIGFTTLSERADPEELVRQLNEYLSRMVKVVFENDGTLDKFIGDAIMAVWGNVQSNGPVADAKECARAALGMRRALKELNDGWKKESRMTLGMGVGINHGEAIAGNIGSGDRADLTVIGDAVNLASRLEALTRTYGVDLLVGETAAALIRDEFHLRSVARVQVKGKTVPVAVYTLIGAKDEPGDVELLKWLESYEEAIEKFRAREFTAAKILFARFLEFYPDDYLAKMYLDSSLGYEEHPPDEAWNAVEVFKKK